MNKLILGGCLEVMSKKEKERIDSVFLEANERMTLKVNYTFGRM